jgi:hypothetical protein
MGYYIDPPNMSKEDWLKEHGIPAPYSSEPEPDGSLSRPKKTAPTDVLVCLVENPNWTAAVICYDKAEFDRVLWGFQNGRDIRPHTWWLVDYKDIIVVCPSVKRDLKSWE